MDIKPTLEEIKLFNQKLLAGWVDSDTIKDTIAKTVPALLVDMQTQIIIHATPPAEELFGYIDGELDGKLLRILIPSDKHTAHDKHLSVYNEHPKKRSMGESKMMLQGIKKDGELVNIEIGLYPKVILGRRITIATILKHR